MSKNQEVLEVGQESLNKLAGQPTDIATGDIQTLNAICQQVIVNKHFRQLGRKSYNQQKKHWVNLSEITDRINLYQQKKQQDSQKEYKDNFYDRHNGWLS